MMSEAFTFKQIKNCRRFIKRCYLTHQNINQKLLERLGVFGFLEIQEFSKYSAKSKDIFKVKMLELIEISGVIDAKELFITVSKEDLSLFEKIETEIENWFLEEI